MPAFPEVPCERLGHELGCSFAHLHTSKKQLGQPAGPLGPAPHSSPWHRGDGNAGSSGDEFILLSQLTKDDQQHGGQFAESLSAG